MKLFFDRIIKTADGEILNTVINVKIVGYEPLECEDSDINMYQKRNMGINSSKNFTGYLLYMEYRGTLYSMYVTQETSAESFEMYLKELEMECLEIYDVLTNINTGENYLGKCVFFRRTQTEDLVYPDGTIKNF